MEQWCSSMHSCDASSTVTRVNKNERNDMISTEEEEEKKKKERWHSAVHGRELPWRNHFSHGYAEPVTKISTQTLKKT